MKLQFKYQKFQADAAKAVADVFDGQPYLAPSYMTGEISGKNSSSEERKGTFSGWSNQKIVPELSDERILDNLRKKGESDSGFFKAGRAGKRISSDG